MKIVKFGLVLLLPAIFVLSGCGKKAPAPAATDSVKTEQPAPEPTVTTDSAKVDSTKKEAPKTEEKKEEKK
ncbi:hypothetical protein MASR1M107_00190 [Ignavibacteriales bacterium]